MNIYHFKVHRHGNKLTITLPSDWVKSNQVKQGSTVTLQTVDNMPYKLIISNISDVERKYYALKSIMEDKTNGL